MNILKSFVAKVIFVTMAVFGGVIAGIYIGFAMVGDAGVTPTRIPTVRTSERPPSVAVEDRLTFGEGDLFPLENFTNPQGDTGNFEQLLMGKKSIVIFAYTGCSACDEFFDMWKDVEPYIKSDVQVVVCSPEGSKTSGESYEEYMEDKRVVLLNSDYIYDKYNINLYPTMIGVDQYGLVLHIQYGYTGYIDPEILAEFTEVKM